MDGSVASKAASSTEVAQVLLVHDHSVLCPCVAYNVTWCIIDIVSQDDSEEDDTDVQVHVQYRTEIHVFVYL